MHNTSTTLLTILFMNSHFLCSHVMRKTEKGAITQQMEDVRLRLKLMNI